jgi:hypothetical protein
VGEYWRQAEKMTITFLNGRAVEAVLLSRSDDTIRLAIEGEDDVTEFRNVSGTWVSEDCEPARIEFAWQRRGHKPTISEADCCCSRDLAARLIQLLFTDSTEEEDVAVPSMGAAEASGMKNAIQRAASAN